MSSPECVTNDIMLVPLKELGHWTGGGTPSKANPTFWENGTIPWVSPKDMKVKQITKTEDYITEAAVRESATNLVPAGSLLMVTRSGILRHTFPVAIASVPVTINQDLKALIPKPGILSKYVAFALNSFSQDILHGCSKQGTTVNSIDTDKLLRFKIPVVSPDQQESIVAEIEKQFSRLDEAVASLKRIQVNLKRYKAAVLKSAVEGKLTEEWRRRGEAVPRPVLAEESPSDEIHQRATHRVAPTETGADLLKRILAERRAKWEAEELAKMKAKGSVGAKHASPDSWKKKYKEPAGPDTANLPELPEGWVWTNVDQLAEVGTGATPRRDRPGYYENGDVPWVTSAVVNKPFVDEASEFVTTSALTETNLTQYPSGTLLIAMYGEGKTRGKCTELRISAATNQALAALQADLSIRRYLRLFLDCNYEETRKVASGGVQPNLNLSLVRSLRLPLPPLFEQLQIVAEIDRRFSVTEELETTIETNLKRAERLRQTILQRAFSGGLVS